jgi:hypothetical protein
MALVLVGEIMVVGPGGAMQLAVPKQAELAALVS